MRFWLSSIALLLTLLLAFQNCGVATQPVETETNRGFCSGNGEPYEGLNPCPTQGENILPPPDLGNQLEEPSNQTSGRLCRALDGDRNAQFKIQFIKALNEVSWQLRFLRADGALADGSWSTLDGFVRFDADWTRDSSFHLQMHSSKTGQLKIQTSENSMTETFAVECEGS